MTTETFTESTEPVPAGPPVPSCREESIGWRIEVLFEDSTDKDKTYPRYGVVKDTDFNNKILVQFDGECPRKCCLYSLAFNMVNQWLGWVPCGCGSGVPEMLCLCEELEVE